MTTIVFSHPWHGSFNKAILDTITNKFDKEKKAYQVIDLPKDNFNPSFTEEELAVYNKGISPYPLVGKYQEIIKKSDEIIFIFPVWWGTYPAILKGFMDKVMLFNFAYNYDNGWSPLLNINKTTVITTSQNKTDAFRNAIETTFINDVLPSIGINNGVWINNQETSTGTDAQRKEFLEKVEALV
jgi:putative NADPH-quinone reductase